MIVYLSAQHNLLESIEKYTSVRIPAGLTTTKRKCVEWSEMFKASSKYNEEGMNIRYAARRVVVAETIPRRAK